MLPYLQAYQHVTSFGTSLEFFYFVSYLEYLNHYSSIHTTYRTLKAESQARSLLTGRPSDWKPTLPNLIFERDSIGKKRTERREFQ